MFSDVKKTVNDKTQNISKISLKLYIELQIKKWKNSWYLGFIIPRNHIYLKYSPS